MARAHKWSRVASGGGVVGVFAAAVATAAGADGPLMPTMLVALATLLGYAHAMGTGARRDDVRGWDRMRTRLRKAEAEAARQREEWETLADGLDEALFLCDARGDVLFANRTALDLFGFESVAGKTILAVTLSHDIERLLAEVSKSGVEQRSELELHLAERRVVAAKAWPGLQGKVLLSMRDLTDLRHLERVRRDFVANVSHELRTPLSVIRAMAETLQEDPEAEELMAKYLDKIVSEVDRLTTITSDLLVLSAGETRPVNFEDCDVAEIVRLAIDQLQKNASSKGLTLSYTGPANCIVRANAAQMNQVATNLLQNALNYTAEGGVEVTLEEGPSDVRIEVKDTGIGIASEHLERIWERFYRVDKGRSRSTGGTGLGLSIVRNLVEAQGGSVSVASALHEGSTFSVVLPR